MTAIDFIAGLPHGEAKAAALTIYNLMTPRWVEITDDPDTLPPRGQLVIIREAGMELQRDQGERFGFHRGPFYDDCGWIWYKSKIASWNSMYQSVVPGNYEIIAPPTHWRPIG